MLPAQARELLLDSGWSNQSVDVWLRAGGRCEYCGRDLLACPDEHFFGSHIDHIDPAGGEHIENWALACKACNFIKRDRVFESGERRLSRVEKLALASAYVRLVRQRNKERLGRSIELLQVCGIKR